MSVQGLVNTAIATAAGVEGVKKYVKEKGIQAGNAEIARIRSEEEKKKIVKGQPSENDVKSAQKKAAEQVRTRASTITAAKQVMQEQREVINQSNRADLIRELRQGGYISGRQAKRVIYNLEKGGAINGTTKH